MSSHPPLQPTRMLVGRALDDTGATVDVCQGVADTAIVAERGPLWPVTVLVQPGVSDQALGTILVAIAHEVCGVEPSTSVVQATRRPRLEALPGGRGDTPAA